jgi:hypothetical protein
MSRDEPNLGEVFRPVSPVLREAELALDRARLAFISARTPLARRKALRRLQDAKRAVEAAR